MTTSFDPMPESLERLAKIAVNAAFQVHSELGPDFWKAFTKSA